jgi:hypothetical protein
MSKEKIRLHAWCLGMLALLLTMLPPAAAADDHVSGEFVVKGKTTKLTHITAYWKPRLGDPSKVDLFVLMSAEPVPPEAMPSSEEAMSKNAELVREGKLHAFELHFDGASDKLFDGEQGAVYHNGIEPARHGISGALQYTPARAPGSVAGRVTVDKGFVELLGWSCDATFQVTIPATK